MAFATTNTTRAVTSIVAGTAIAGGGNVARFTHASTTAYAVGELVVNTGFANNDYNEGGRVSASTVTYYEFPGVTFVATGTGTANTIHSKQTGTDVVTSGTTAPAGFTSTDRGNYRTFSLGTNSLAVDGNLTFDSTTCKVSNTAGSRLVSVRAGAVLTFDGRRSSAANAPFPNEGFDWQWTGNQFKFGCIRLDGTDMASNVATLNLYDAAIRFGTGYAGVQKRCNGIINTFGEACWLLPGSATTSRLRIEPAIACLNFQAKKTYVGVFLNIAANQPSLKGLTPLACDATEVNAGSITTASKVTIEDYDSTFITTAHDLQLWAGHYAHLLNNRYGTNFGVRYSQPGGAGDGHNVISTGKAVSATALKLDGTALSDGQLYWQPVGANVAGIRAKAMVADITFDLALQKVTYVAGAATGEVLIGWFYDIAAGPTVLTTYNYFCSTTTPGAEAHVIWSSRYGYDKQSRTVSLSGNGAASLTFAHASLQTTTKNIADAAAITQITVNDACTIFTIAAGFVRTVQELYDRYQWQLQQDASLFVVDTVEDSGGVAIFAGKTLVLGGIIAGGNFSGLSFSTISMTTGSSIDGLAVLETLVTATSPAVVAAGIQDVQFTRGAAGHAIEIAGTAADFDLTGVTFTGYASVDGSTGNEAVYVNIATGSMTISILGGGSVPSIRTGGAAVTVVSGIVSVTITAKDIDGNNVQDARVLVQAAAGGPLPFDATVTIVNAGTTATVTHTAHGMSTSDKVNISGASHAANNGVYTITKINANSYSYTMGSAPGSNPTGTIKATFVALFGLTNASGVLTANRSFLSNQPVTGRVRRSTSGDLYKTTNVSGTITSAAGFAASVQMLAD